jgi:tetratricopeptide (TPR) repeat protein
MKKLILLVVVMSSISITAQTKTELQKHFESYYKQMKKQGDIQGVINAMTHLDVLAPTQARKDTLAYIYVSEGRNMEALNTIGIEKSGTDSDLNTEIKAIALNAVGERKRALEFYNVLFSKKPTPAIAYEMADLMLQTGDLTGAKEKVEYGLANATDDMRRTYYETQQPYQTSLKAGFLYLKAIVTYSEDKDANQEIALATLNRALAIDPNFNMAKISKDALLTRKKGTD